MRRSRLASELCSSPEGGRINTQSLLACLFVAGLSIAAATQALGQADRVFVSARSGNNAFPCDSVNAPCQSLAGAMTKVNPGGAVIVLDSGSYGPVKIFQAVTIEAAPGVTAFIHPTSGDAIEVKSDGDVTLRGLTLKGGTNGITVTRFSVGNGTLHVENCFITGFSNAGIQMLTRGDLIVTGTDITACGYGVSLASSTRYDSIRASIDHCHLDGNLVAGFVAQTTYPVSSTTTAKYTTANNNSSFGWICGNGSTGNDTLNLEFCSGSSNGLEGLRGISSSAATVARYSNCVFANNGHYGVYQSFYAGMETRGNNTITGNGIAPTNNPINVIAPM